MVCLETDTMSLFNGLLIISTILTSLLYSTFHAEEVVPIESLHSWCGAKCLLLIARIEQPSLEFEQVRNLCDPGGKSDGILNLQDLADAASKLGLEVSVRQASPSWLKGHLPAIVLLEAFGPDNPGHFVVVTSIDGDNVSFVDPALGSTLHTVELKYLRSIWSGYCLVAGPVSLTWTKELFVLLLVLSMSSFLAWPAIVRLVLASYMSLKNAIWH